MRLHVCTPGQSKHWPVLVAYLISAEQIWIQNKKRKPQGELVEKNQALLIPCEQHVSITST